MSKPIGDIELQIMWNRLIAVVEEQAQTLLRTAFSSIVREAGDLSAGIFDRTGPHAGAGRHRHAGPRQLHGGVGQALHRPFRARQHAAGRRLHHQRSLDGHRPPQRLRHHHALLPQGQAGRPVLLHLAPDGHRRHRLRSRRHRRVHGGALHPLPQGARRRQGQRDADGDDPRQHAPADRHRRRRLFADGLQRRRLPAPRGDDGRVPSRQSRRAGRAHLRQEPRGRAGRDRAAAEGLVVQRHDHRRLRRADHAARHHHHQRYRHPRRLHRHRPAGAARHQRAVRLHHGLHRVRARLHRGQPHPQQRGLAGAADGVGARGLHPQCQASRPPSASAT